MEIDDVVSRACCDARNIEHTGQKLDGVAVATLVLPQLWTVHVSFSPNIRSLPLIPLRSAKYRSVCALDVCLLNIF